jgi:2,4-dienoyl-CoA reductase (NADPH2)
MLRAATVPPGKQDLSALVRNLVHQAEVAGVKRVLGRKLTPEMAARERPDVVIIASGGRPAVPPIEGIAGRHVFTAVDLLRGRREPSGKAVVIGGGLVGCEVAEWLAERGHEVVILEMLPRIGSDFGQTTRWLVLQRLRKAGVRMETGARVTRILESGVEVDRGGGAERFEAETIVLAAGMTPTGEVVEAFRSGDWHTIAIGDAVQPRRIREAILEGFRAGMAID